MLRTIDRYVIREILPPFFLSLLIFTFLLEIPPVMGDLETARRQGGALADRRADPADAAPAGARPDDPDGAAGRAPDRARPAVRRPRGGRAPGLRRQPLPAAPAGPAPGGRRRGRDPLYVMLVGHPGRQPDLPRDHLRRDLASRSRPTSSRGSSSRTFPAGCSTSATSPTPGGGWKDVLVADTSKPDATDAVSRRARPAGPRPREADASTWS